MTVLTTLADPELGALDGLIDLDRYPLDKPGSDEWRAAVATVQQRLTDHGLVSLPGFLLPEALAAAAYEVSSAVPHVSIRRYEASVYHRASLESEVGNEPWFTKLTWFAGHVTRDMIPPYAVSHRLYVSPLFKGFIAACTNRDRVYEYADPIAGLVATVLPPTGQYPWHYDTNEYVVTIMTQQPDGGGAFEYCKDLRNAGDENLEGLAQVLAGGAESIQRVETSPGDLQLFLGRYSLHQVTPVVGETERHVLVLSYADRPGVIGPVDRTRSVYGRVTEAHLVAEDVRVSQSDGLIL